MLIPIINLIMNCMVQRMSVQYQCGSAIHLGLSDE